MTSVIPLANFCYVVMTEPEAGKLQMSPVVHRTEERAQEAAANLAKFHRVKSWVLYFPVPEDAMWEVH